ncbi:hypothetical protein F5884DRAFT_807134 [Xylogone sp. PMI_703]|nr:hypothetical protein F5884DRAFT_807134 [Xylogone sp. PMI_703]
MGRPQKKSRTSDPKAEQAAVREGDSKATSTPKEHSNLSTTPSTVSASKDISKPLKDSKADTRSVKQLAPKNSWYGSLARKSQASIQVAKETILADKPEIGNGNPSPTISRFEGKNQQATTNRPPLLNVGKSKGTADVTFGETLNRDLESTANPKPIEVGPNERKTNPPRMVEDKPVEQVKNPQPVLPPETSGWLGWWSKPTNNIPSNKPEDSHPVTEATPVAETQPTTENRSTVGDQNAEINTTTSAATTRPSSWFRLWGADPNSGSSQPSPNVTESPAKTSQPAKSIEVPKEELSVDLENAKKATNSVDPSVSVPESVPKARSSWAFWSSDSNKSTNEPVGQVAVTGEASQSNPEPVMPATVQDTARKTPNKRERPLSVDLDELSRKAARKPIDPTSSQASLQPKPSPPNLILPSVKSTYRMMDNPSILQQLTRLLVYNRHPPAKHLFLVKTPPKIKKALAIGVHGFFPAPLLRTVIGQPTGTSIRFANNAAAAIRRWADQHGCTDCEIEKVALEGEGRIADRVDNLWKLLLNWVDHIRTADFVMVACHSQGVPVSVMLVAKLIELGVVSSSKIGICAMAGVSLGPFADYKSRLISGSAGELFDFANPDSTVSQRYEESLRVVLHHGVRVTFCGSIDDQLVSMESSIFSTVSHPYIYRAVFVDGRIHAPDFIAHLVGFALKLRNLGVSDHGLIRELSAPLAGSLYTGEGHSRLYDDDQVFDLATEFALETTSADGVPLQVDRYEIPKNSNPYVLPWIMRGLLEEEFVKSELGTETMELLKQFDDWKPTTKVLKDVKYRLEAVRSKL